MAYPISKGWQQKSCPFGTEEYRSLRIQKCFTRENCSLTYSLFGFLVLLSVSPGTCGLGGGKWDDFLQHLGCICHWMRSLFYTKNIWRKNNKWWNNKCMFSDFCLFVFWLGQSWEFEDWCCSISSWTWNLCSILLLIFLVMPSSLKWLA